MRIRERKSMRYLLT